MSSPVMKKNQQPGDEKEWQSDDEKEWQSGDEKKISSPVIQKNDTIPSEKLLA